MTKEETLKERIDLLDLHLFNCAKRIHNEINCDCSFNLRSIFTRLIDEYAEERLDQVLPERNPFSADKDNKLKHCYQNEGFNSCLDQIEENRKK